MEKKSVQVSEIHGNEILSCPVCDGKHMHQRGVEIYRRNGEDSSVGQNVDVSYKGETTMNPSVSREDGNPSRRRDGIVIHFLCESCNNDELYDLVIKQHKGNEIVEWRVPDE